jgi:hypothetical protein
MSKGSGISRTDRRRNARKERLRGMVPRGGAVIPPDRGDPLGRDRCLAGRFLLEPDQAQVERCPAAVAADLEHVVLVRADRAAAHLLGALAELRHVLQQLVRWLDGHDLGYPSAVFAGADRRDREVQVLGWPASAVSGFGRRLRPARSGATHSGELPALRAQPSDP